MTKEKWYYIKNCAEKHNTRFIRCDTTLYEVTKTYYPTGDSPQWTVDEVNPVDVPKFVPTWHLDE